MEPLAIVGFSFKMPGEAVDESSLWGVLENRKNLMTEWPETRASVDSFVDGGSKKQNTLHGRGGHFLDQDPWAFDAPFFSITANEAAAMDPQQRLMLQTAYHAFENAGIPAANLQGSRTAVFEASMSDDYAQMYAKDPGTAPRMASTGTAASMRANRISCPEMSMLMSNMNFLSPDSVCYSFDHRANGMEAQEQLIRHVYGKAGLEFGLTRYFEAHGTGTATGDPIEMKAIGRVFRTYRSDEEPLYVGSIKSSIGHLEGASGLAGIIKAILILEKGVIPPNALFDKVNPAIDVDFYHTVVPTQSMIWPTGGLRRVSVNSFGIGDENSIKRVVHNSVAYFNGRILDNPGNVERFAYTLAARRSHMAWRTFAVTGSTTAKEGLPPVEKPTRASAVQMGVAFVFTGQGAQYAGMGVELVQYPVFRDTLDRIDTIFASLGCGWSIFDVLQRHEVIDHPEYSQPLCTALQVALVELLRYFGIVPVTVLGHSSGEIAAAYTVGALSLEAACAVAYHRGQIAGKLSAAAYKASHPIPVGAMISVNLSQDQVQDYLETVSITEGGGRSTLLDNVHVACVNSPTNCTLSGNETSIDILKAQFDKDEIFAQKLNTGGVAYHCPAMRMVAPEYQELLGFFSECDTPARLSGQKSAIQIISSVTGDYILPDILSTSQYWVDNLVSPVRFMEAVSNLTKGGPTNTALQRYMRKDITDVIEVGPHSALRRLIQDNLIRRPEIASPRMSRDFRMRRSIDATGGGGSELLGKPLHDWNPLEPRWRNFLSIESIPWLGGHIVSDTTVLPGTAMLVMAIEATRQHFGADTNSATRQLSGFHIKQAHFLNPIIVSEVTQNGTETLLHLRQIQRSQFDRDMREFKIRIFACHNRDRWTECFRCRIQVELEGAIKNQLDRDGEKQWRDERIAEADRNATDSCIKPIDSAKFYNYLRDHVGVKYNDSFRILQDIRWDNHETAMARVSLLAGSSRSPSSSPRSPRQHPNAIVLDSAVHLVLAQVSKGLSGSKHTLVLRQLSHTWVSAKLWETRLPELTSSVRLLNRMNGPQGKFGDTKSSIYGLADSGEVLFAMEQVDMAAVARTRSPGEGHGYKQLLHKVDWKPQLSLLSSEQLQGLICTPAPPSDYEKFMVTFYPKIESAMAMSVRKTLKDLALEKRSPDYPPWLKRFLSTLQYFYADRDGLDNPEGVSSSAQNEIHNGAFVTSDEELEALLRQCEEEHPSWQMFPVVARHLTSIIRGDVDPIDLVFTPRLAEKFYASLFDQICDHRFQTLFELLCHESPGLKLLEVGAGTGGMTRRTLAALQKVEATKGVTSFSEYTYTDISPAFFESARNEFQDFQDRMTFKKLDLEHDAHLEGGFDLEAYDILIASCVIHATTNITTTLGNIRQLLKPNGYLILLEIIAPNIACGNAGFGVFPGWWLSSEEWRLHSPLISEDQWDSCLRRAGFSGNHLILRDYKSDVCHISSIMVTRKVAQLGHQTPQLKHSLSKQNLLVVIDETADRQVAVANVICAGNKNATVNAEVFKWSDVIEQGHNSPLLLAASNPDAVVISLLEVGSPFISHISESNFYLFQRLIQRLRNLLWVTLTCLDDSKYSHFYAMSGFLRAMQSEYAEKHIVSLAIEAPSLPVHPGWETAIAGAESCARHISTILNASFTLGATSSSSSVELEYIVQDGYITTGRLVEEVSTGKRLHHLISPELRVEPWMPGPALKLDVRVPGALDSFQFVEDTSNELGEYEVEIEAKVWPLSFRDLFVALGRIAFDTLGLETAGIVTRVGTSVAATGPEQSAAARLQPGDRVCMASLHGSMRTYPREPADFVFKIPEVLSFEAAASTINPGTTAYYGLIKLARLQKGEKVLIHSAAGSTGQMAVWVAKMVGAEIFATVGHDFKRQLLVDNFNIPADHIFYSRDTSFAEGIKRVTDGKGVDVVFNSLAGEGLRSSWECVAPFGRFVEIGKADILSNTGLPMAGFAGNVSFFSVDLHHLAVHNRELFSNVMRDVLELLEQGVISHPQPLHFFPVSEVEKAFRFMQGGRNTGRIIITTDHSSVVPKLIREQDDWKLDETASYLIPGGLGGIGRAIVKWMADKGAKHMILPSRSGLSPSAKAASEVVLELQNRGVRVATPRCDVSSSSSLSAMLDDCAKTMPPIKGCINAAMVLQDAVFENMSYQQWDLTLRSKIDTSWNLHRLLPPGNLDFFIFLSSLSGIYGSIAQSNYAAGCTVQDALARQRASQGENAVSLDIGWMRTIGIIAETEEYQRNRENSRDMAAIETEELLGLLNLCCNTASRISTPQTESSQRSTSRGDGSLHPQILIGALTPADLYALGEAPTPLLQRPIFSGFAQQTSTSARSLAARNGGEPTAEDVALAFRQAVGSKNRAAIVVQAVTARLARALSVSPENVEPYKLLSDYGIDSLMAVELRNWISMDFQANVAVFDIMGGITITALGDLVAERSELH
ncbi:hypothetical protein DL766_002690 [Monosporascus sp. MC13-8B]|uniref:Carrier domain-containing protein n=1 Tax=Monosporascus cannonballus TaxID=155416 RepID=A0ABY0H3N3_9PEZI|nr:hypothetical protein DL762_006186 [Monosporascus cannonballus]RYP35126.1 hypothetical protein DL766_002690 [Monosporascus sp. MC13-8B]